MADEQTTRHAARRPPLAAAVEAAGSRCTTLDQRYADCSARWTAREDARAALAALGGEAAECGAQLRAAQAEARRDETAANAANDRLQAVQRASAGRAAAYAEETRRLGEARAAAEKRRLTIEHRYDECRAHAQAAQEAGRKVAGHRQRRDALTRRLETAVAEAREAGSRRQEADEHLTAMRRSDSAAAAARDLHAGDPCPVCLRELPAEWAAPASAGLHEATAAAKRAGREADAAGERVIALTTERTGVEGQIDEAVPQADAAGEAFRAALRALGKEAGGDPHHALPDRDAVIGPLDTALRAASETLDRYERDHAARAETLTRQVQEAHAAREAAQGASAATGRRAAALAADLQGLERQIDAARDRAGATAEALAASKLALGEAAGITLADTLPDHGALRGPFDAAAREAADALARHDHEHETLQNESRSRSGVKAAATAAADGARTLACARRDAAATALQQVHEAIRAVPAPFRPSLDLPVDPAGLQQVDTTAIGERLTSARDREQVLAERDAERTRLRQEIAAAGKDRDTLARRKADEVDAPIRGIVHDLDQHRSMLMKAAWDIDSSEAIPAAVAPEDTGALRSWIDTLRTTTLNVNRAAHAHAKAAATRAGTARTDLAAIAALLAVDVDADDLDVIVNAARTAAAKGELDALKADENAGRFAAIIDDVQRLRALLAEATDKERALADLEEALKPGAFLRWLTLRRSRRLLVHASRMLGEMSGDKYAFVDPGETEEQWRVLDRDSGQARSPASLSGGEQFIASLSLALGMVEMMARSGGRLESLFLDEGFGSLDRNNLDAAVQALGTIAAGGRMVGVISHVRAVAEQIEHVLAVTPRRHRQQGGVAREPGAPGAVGVGYQPGSCDRAGGTARVDGLGLP